MTKKRRIMALRRQGKTTRQIVCEVYDVPANAPGRRIAGKMAYVRVVTRQRCESSRSRHDWAYLAANRDKVLASKRRYFVGRYHADLKWQRLVRDRNAAWQKSEYGRRWNREYRRGKKASGMAPTHVG